MLRFKGPDDVSKWFIIKISGIKTKPYLFNNNLDILMVLKDSKIKNIPFFNHIIFKK